MKPAKYIHAADADCVIYQLPHVCVYKTVDVCVWESLSVCIQVHVLKDVLSGILAEHIQWVFNYE